MSAQDVAVASTMLEAIKAGDVEAAVSAFHPDCVVREAASLPYGGTFTGQDGFRELLGIMAAKFDIAINSYEVWDAGEVVAMRADAMFTAHTNGKTLNTQITEIYRVRDGMIIDADIYPKDAMAIHLLARDGTPASPG